jgi:acetyltransferase-like isoleucine patch superfamily enzyme
MKTEKEKMLAGEPYIASDAQLVQERLKAREIVFEINQLSPRKANERAELFRQLLGKSGEHFLIEPPFHCDYGYNIELGENFFANFNLIILDCAKVTIGDYVFAGPNVGLYTAGHPVHHEPRNREYEYAIPITIGNNVWIGGNVVIGPGIRVGDNTVIGAGSIVTHDIPPGVIAVGNPCRVLREIKEADKQYYFRERKF